MNKTRLLFLSLFSFVCLSFCQPVAELKVLAIGNSFSGNAYQYLSSIIDAHGKVKATLGNASIGGCSLERHWREHQKSLADPAHKPYTFQKKKISLRDFLVAEQWDVVTLQQNSLNSFKPETFQPWADHLAELIKQLAPQAKIHVHQTWAYRPDHRLFLPEKNFTPEQMYQQSGDAYRQLAAHLQAPMIPAGDAMWTAYHTQTPKPIPVDPDFDLKQATHPNLPKDVGPLINGHRWRKNAKTGKMTLSYDGTHANLRGCYLIGCVWYAFIFQQDLSDLNFAPEGIDQEDAKFLRKVAQETAQKQRGK